ncbi:MAG: hypothetical protein KGH85_07810 [Thaumarchaeota archaeon]|nr:hypothetical protein [Nitrososphaerota archaeon]
MPFIQTGIVDGICDNTGTEVATVGSITCGATCVVDVFGCITCGTGRGADDGGGEGVKHIVLSLDNTCGNTH